MPEFPRTLALIRPGSDVLIGEKGRGIRGHVVAAQIQNTGEVSYVVSWWSGTERRMQVISPVEISPSPQTRFMEMSAPREKT